MITLPTVPSSAVLDRSSHPGTPALQEARRDRGAAARVAVRVATVWRNAQVIPGIAALNEGGNARVVAIACKTAGNCTAVGNYMDAAGNTQPFVVDERAYSWGAAEEVPGIAALDQTAEAKGSAVFTGLSCVAAGECTAGGWYFSTLGSNASFVVDETNGVWGRATMIPGLQDLQAISCPSARACTAAGLLEVASEVNGTWRPAHAVPGLPAIAGGGDDAELSAISCASPGNCSVGGGLYDPGADPQGPDPVPYTEAFVANEVRGTWHPAQVVGKTVDYDNTAALNSMSCASAGNCAAGGYANHAFVAREENGRWGDASQVRGVAQVARGAIEAVSCPSAGHCSAVGIFEKTRSSWGVFSVNEDGSWGRAAPLVQPASVSTSTYPGAPNGYTPVLSCSDPGDCAVGEISLATETRGIWGPLLAIPGMHALGTDPIVSTISCASPGRCSAGGTFTTPSGSLEAFVIDEH